ncbi:MAG: hypothetical protein EOO41_04875, partial [Methanobacteriota archaeon]
MGPTFAAARIAQLQATVDVHGAAAEARVQALEASLAAATEELRRRQLADVSASVKQALAAAPATSSSGAERMTELAAKTVRSIGMEAAASLGIALPSSISGAASSERGSGTATTSASKRVPSVTRSTSRGRANSALDSAEPVVGPVYEFELGEAAGKGATLIRIVRCRSTDDIAADVATLDSATARTDAAPLAAPAFPPPGTCIQLAGSSATVDVFILDAQPPRDEGCSGGAVATENACTLHLEMPLPCALPTATKLRQLEVNPATAIDFLRRQIRSFLTDDVLPGILNAACEQGEARLTLSRMDHAFMMRTVECRVPVSHSLSVAVHRTPAPSGSERPPPALPALHFTATGMYSPAASSAA